MSDIELTHAESGDASSSNDRLSTSRNGGESRGERARAADVPSTTDSPVSAETVQVSTKAPPETQSSMKVSASLPGPDIRWLTPSQARAHALDVLAEAKASRREELSAEAERESRVEKLS